MLEIISAFIDEAFAMGAIYRVWAVCGIDNHASRRAMEKAYMKHEGVLRSWILHPNMGNSPRDCHCLATTK